MNDYIYTIFLEGKRTGKYFATKDLAEKYLKLQGYFHKKVNYGGFDYLDDCNNLARINPIYCPSWVRSSYEIIEEL